MALAEIVKLLLKRHVSERDQGVAPVANDEDALFGIVIVANDMVLDDTHQRIGRGIASLRKRNARPVHVFQDLSLENRVQHLGRERVSRPRIADDEGERAGALHRPLFRLRGKGEAAAKGVGGVAQKRFALLRLQGAALGHREMHQADQIWQSRRIAGLDARGGFHLGAAKKANHCP